MDDCTWCSWQSAVVASWNFLCGYFCVDVLKCGFKSLNVMVRVRAAALVWAHGMKSHPPKKLLVEFCLSVIRWICSVVAVSNNVRRSYCLLSELIVHVPCVQPDTMYFSDFWDENFSRDACLVSRCRKIFMKSLFLVLLLQHQHYT